MTTEGRSLSYGHRTGVKVLEGRNICKNQDELDMFEDYFTDSGEDSENCAWSSKTRKASTPLNKVHKNIHKHKDGHAKKTEDYLINPGDHDSEKCSLSSQTQKMLGPLRLKDIEDLSESSEEKVKQPSHQPTSVVESSVVETILDGVSKDNKVYMKTSADSESSSINRSKKRKINPEGVNKAFNLSFKKKAINKHIRKAHQTKISEDDDEEMDNGSLISAYGVFTSKGSFKSRSNSSKEKQSQNVCKELSQSKIAYDTHTKMNKASKSVKAKPKTSSKNNQSEAVSALESVKNKLKSRHKKKAESEIENASEANFGKIMLTNNQEVESAENINRIEYVKEQNVVNNKYNNKKKKSHNISSHKNCSSENLVGDSDDVINTSEIRRSPRQRFPVLKYGLNQNPQYSYENVPKQLGICNTNIHCSTAGITKITSRKTERIKVVTSAGKEVKFIPFKSLYSGSWCQRYSLTENISYRTKRLYQTSNSAFGYMEIDSQKKKTNWVSAGRRFTFHFASRKNSSHHRREYFCAHKKQYVYNT